MDFFYLFQIYPNRSFLCYSQLHIAIVNELDNPHIISAIIRLAPAPWLLDIKNDYAQAPIHLAALTGQSDIVRRLLVAGAKVCLTNEYTHTLFSHSFKMISVSPNDVVIDFTRILVLHKKKR